MKSTPGELNRNRTRTTRHLLQLCLLPLSLALVCAGCKPDAKAAAEINPKAVADTNPVGSYALVSVDGSQVPCTVQHEGHTITIKSGSFSINADGTCSSKMAFATPSGGDASREVKAAYTQQGPRLTMKWQGAGTTTGTVAGDTFTMNNEGMVLAYRK